MSRTSTTIDDKDYILLRSYKGLDFFISGRLIKIIVQNKKFEGNPHGIMILDGVAFKFAEEKKHD